MPKSGCQRKAEPAGQTLAMARREIGGTAWGARPGHGRGQLGATFKKVLRLVNPIQVLWGALEVKAEGGSL